MPWENKKMKKILKRKIFYIILSGLVTLSYSAVIPSSIISAEGETTTTQTKTINWKDPNNWYEQWLAGQKAKKAAAEAAAAAAAANTNTGADSYNESTTNTKNSTNTDINNVANIDNLVDGNSNTGNNNTNSNTGDGVISTGNSTLAGNIQTTANTVSVGSIGSCTITGGCGTVSIKDLEAANDTTGAGSFNIADNQANNDSNLGINNDADLYNFVNFHGNTGSNTADKNTGDGSITTGDANIIFNLINFLNNVFLGGSGELLIGIVNIFGTLEGNIVLQGINEEGAGTSGLGSELLAGNSTTGAGSENTTSNSATNTTNTDLTNIASVQNNVKLDGNTGENDASKNTGSGIVETGNINSNLNVATVANTSGIGNGGDIWMVLINNMGTWTGQLYGGTQSNTYSPFFTFTVNPDGSIMATNNTTGADSFNETANSVENETDITVNNTGNLVNNINLNANTGDNSASANTGTGSIKTGNVNIAANIVNFLNNTFIGSRFLLTIVNIFGAFNGSIGPAGSEIDNIKVDANELVSLPTKNSSGGSVNPESGWSLSRNGFGVFQSSQEESGNQHNNENRSNNLILVAGKNISGDFNQITRFSADRGIFDGFRLEYLLIPAILGTLFSVFRRVVVRR